MAKDFIGLYDVTSCEVLRILKFLKMRIGVSDTMAGSPRSSSVSTGL